MDLGLAGKTVVITGGSRGIGFACAQAFLSEGAKVCIVGKRRETIDYAVHQLEAAHPNKVAGIVADLSMESGRTLIRQQVLQADVLVNNAGAIPGGTLESLPPDVWQEAWDLKVYGFLDTCRAALPAMRERSCGVIVNVIGMAGVKHSYSYVCGSMANAGLIAFTKAAGADAAKYGVRVVGVNPGPTKTDRMKELEKSKGVDPSAYQKLPFQRPAEPEEIANVVLFLASQMAGCLSGVVIDADGGSMYVG
jgi:3-oxoacyl-[acyl-carrier protein] reductase